MSIIENILNQGIVAKQLAILFLENGYRLGYDKRFESLKPQLSKDIDYLYDDFESDKKRPKYYFTVKSEEVEGYIQVSGDFDGMHFTKYSHQSPRNGRIRHMNYLPDDVLYKEVLSVDRAKEIAQSIFDQFSNADPFPSGVPKYVIAKPYMTYSGKEDFDY